MDAVYLRPEDPELRRAWHTFPDPIMHDDKPCHDFLYNSGAFRRLYPVGINAKSMSC